MAYPDGALGLTGAAFGFNDPTGTLLANRGWAFDSRPIGLFGEEPTDPRQGQVRGQGHLDADGAG